MIIKRYIYLSLLITQIYSLSISKAADVKKREDEPFKQESLEETIAQLTDESQTSWEATSRSKRKAKNQSKKPSRYPDLNTIFLTSATLLSAFTYNSVKSSNTVMPPPNTTTTYIYTSSPENTPPLPVKTEEEPKPLSENEQIMSDVSLSLSEENELPLSDESVFSQDPPPSQEPIFSQAPPPSQEPPLSIVIIPPSVSDDPPPHQTSQSHQASQSLQTAHLIQPTHSIESTQSSILTQTEGRTTAGGPGASFDMRVPTATAPPVNITSDESSTEVLNSINIPPVYYLSSDADAYDGDKSEDTDVENKSLKRKKIKRFFHIKKKIKKKNSLINSPKSNTKLQKAKKKVRDYGQDIGNEINENIKEHNKTFKKIKKLRIKSYFEHRKKDKKNKGEVSLSEENIVDEQTTDNDNKGNQISATIALV